MNSHATGTRAAQAAQSLEVSVVDVGVMRAGLSWSPSYPYGPSAEGTGIGRVHSDHGQPAHGTVAVWMVHIASPNDICQTRASAQGGAAAARMSERESRSLRAVSTRWKARRASHRHPRRAGGREVYWWGRWR